jgi:hypothetical protein
MSPKARSTIILAEDEAEWRANLPLLSFASSLEKLVCRAVNLFSPTPLGRCAIHARHSGDVMVITWAAPSKEQRGIRVGVSPYRRAIIWKARGRPASRRTSSTVDVLAPRHPLQCDGGDGGTMAKDDTASLVERLLPRPDTGKANPRDSGDSWKARCAQDRR